MTLTRCEHTFYSGNEGAVSEVIGSVMLISIVVIAVSIVGVVLWSQPPPEKIPALSAGIANQSCKVILTHNGGDVLEQQLFKIYVGTDDRTSQFNKTGSPGAWTTWAIGEMLVYDPPSPCIPPDRVQIVYIGGNGALVLSSAYFGTQPSGTGTATPTTTTPVPPPAANFTANPLIGTVPLPVSFTDASTGSPTGWNWTFGDIGGANTSTSQNPSHTYAGAGTYTVTLVASNAGGSSAITRTNYITVNVPAPVAAFTGTPLSGTAPLPVTFTDTSTNIPTGWKWSFRNITPGNNTQIEFSTLQNPMMTFGAGNYSIVLNASNSGGFNMSSQVTFINVSRIFSPWSYYREITVTNSPAIANYQMTVNVPYDAHMKTDFGDIRFMGTDGTTVYDYWMEKKTDGTSAVFWVKVPTASTTTFRMYYGNSSQTTTSDGTNTFDFFDDFSIDLSKWTVEKTSGVYPRIESGYLVAGGGTTSGTYGHTSLGSSASYNGFQDGIVEFKHQHSTDAIGEVAFRGNFAINRGYKGRWDARTGSEAVFLMPPYSGWANLGSAVTKWITAGTWYEGKLVVHGNVMDLYDDGNFKGTVTDNTYASAGEIALQNHYGSYTNFDDVRVRKYSATEPTTSIGSEITV
jgi:PKD repeat protein